MRWAPGTQWVLAAAIAVGSGLAGAHEPAEVEALRLCADADDVDGETREAMLGRALALANEATRLNPDRADAHFAVFCALGKQLADRGISFRSLGDLRRVRSAVDRTLELNPDHVDALIGKASMLRRLPRLLGGDAAEADRYLERAHRVGPEHPMIRMMSSSAGQLDVATASH